MNGNERVSTSEGTEVGSGVAHIHVRDAEVVVRSQILKSRDICVSSGDNDTIGLHGESSSDVERRSEADEGERLGDGEGEVSSDGQLSVNRQTSSVGTGDHDVTVRASSVGELRGDEGAIARSARGDVGVATEGVDPKGLATAARVVNTDSQSLTSQLATRFKQKIAVRDRSEASRGPSVKRRRTTAIFEAHSSSREPKSPIMGCKVIALTYQVPGRTKGVLWQSDKEFPRRSLFNQAKAKRNSVQWRIKSVSSRSQAKRTVWLIEEA